MARGESKVGPGLPEASGVGVLGGKQEAAPQERCFLFI